MSIHNLKEELDKMTALKEDRQRVANFVLENQLLFKDLVMITFQVEHKISIKAAWVLEWICTNHHLEWILSHLDEFSAKIATLKFDSAIRPCAKICEHLAIAYHAENKSEVQNKLKNIHINTIIETGFDWLITPQKIAVRAYTMSFLYYFGLEKDWVHPALKNLIEATIIHESKGTKARGNHILTLIKKNNKLH
ncbi:MAG: hypothetical protein ACJA1B_003090 [Polaribacter sp.]|jgi:hypothetical protein